jgi:hypothetical protein
MEPSASNYADSPGIDRGQVEVQDIYLVIGGDIQLSAQPVSDAAMLGTSSAATSNF